MSLYLKLCRSAAGKQTVNKQSNKQMNKLTGKQIYEQTKYYQNDKTKYWLVMGLTTRSKLGLRVIYTGEKYQGPRKPRGR